jgi:hypothetical protein
LPGPTAAPQDLNRTIQMTLTDEDRIAAFRAYAVSDPARAIRWYEMEKPAASVRTQLSGANWRPKWES